MTYGNDSLCGAVAKQRFASAADVTLSHSQDDAESDDDRRLMQFILVLSITTAADAAAERRAYISAD